MLIYFVSYFYTEISDVSQALKKKESGVNNVHLKNKNNKNKIKMTSNSFDQSAKHTINVFFFNIANTHKNLLTMMSDKTPTALTYGWLFL